MVDAPGQRDKDRGRTAEGDRRRDAVQGCVAAATSGHVDQPQARGGESGEDESECDEAHRMIAVAFVPVREMCGHRVGVHGVPPGGFPPAGLVGSAFQPTPVCCSSHMTFDPFLVVVQCRDQPGDLWPGEPKTAGRMCCEDHR